MTILTVAGVVVAALTLATALAMLIGKSIRRADEQLAREVAHLADHRARRSQQ